MRRYLLVAAVLAAAVTLAGSGLAGGAPVGAATAGTRAAPGSQLWVARFRAGGPALSSAMAVSPAGRRVFVTGETYDGPATGADYETAAYSAAAGRLLWARRYSGPGKGEDTPAAVAVSPDGRSVFVTGDARGWGTGYDYATIAYSAATGRRVWVSRYTGAGQGADTADAVAVSPDGDTVFVTGSSQGRGTGQSDYATVAYSAATGRQLWVSRYNGPGNEFDGASSVAVSPSGDRVFVTGTSDGRATGGDYATVAYSAATGRQLWVSRYNGPANKSDGASSVVVSPAGAAVFVTGTSDGRATGGDYATVAYSAATGRQLWVRRYNGGPFDSAASVAVSPGGAAVFVTGTSGGGGNDDHYATVAYSAATGRQLWASRYHGYEAASVAVSSAGTTVYVTGAGHNGAHGDYATVAYRAATGIRLWVIRYTGPGNYDDGACCVTVSPQGPAVFVTGFSYGTTTSAYATIAYRG
jgi:WD40 repeat protein